MFTRMITRQRASGDKQRSERKGRPTKVGDKDWRTLWIRQLSLCCALSSGTTGDVFGVHGDKVVYDDSAHGKGTERIC